MQPATLLSKDLPATILVRLNQYLTTGDLLVAEDTLVALLENNEFISTWTQTDRFELHCISVEIALALNRPHVEELLISIDGKTKEQRDAMIRLWIKVLVNQRRLVEATILANRSSLYQKDPQSRSDVMWSIVLNSTPFDVDRFLQLAPESEVRAWWELAQMYQTSLSDAGWRHVWETWNTTHRNHLARRFPPAQLQVPAETVDSIAVLLPQSGPLKGAANSIRDGILAAYMWDKSFRDGSDTLTINFLDSSDQDIPKLIHTAFDIGAKAVIGPLSKQSVEDAISERDYPGPVLLLNRAYMEQDPGENIRQLALAVEDEALFHAEFLRQNQQSNVVLVHGNSLWSTRATIAFRRRASPEIQVIDIASLNELATVTETIAELFDVDESTIRKDRVAAITRLRLEFTPRRRQDIDAIVAYIDPPEFEALIAALRFHFANDIDLYVAEAAVRDIAPNDDANGVVFSTSPWLVFDTPLETRIQTIFNPTSEALPLFSFGVDAYKFVNNWNQFDRRSSIGANTGYYQLGDKGILKRSPIWGHVVNGKLMPLEKFEVNTLREIPLL